MALPVINLWTGRFGRIIKFAGIKLTMNSLNALSTEVDSLYALYSWKVRVDIEDDSDAMHRGHGRFMKKPIIIIILFFMIVRGRWDNTCLKTGNEPRERKTTEWREGFIIFSHCLLLSFICISSHQILLKIICQWGQLVLCIRTYW